MATPRTTKLDDDNTRPAVTAPGDGPADTVDPLERASTVLPQPSQDTIRSGAGTVNSQLPFEPIADPDAGRRRGQEPRLEEYEATDATGKRVRVQRNVDTGESRIMSGRENTDTGSTATQRGNASA